MRPILYALLLALILPAASARADTPVWDIRFDFSSIELLLLHPERVLEDPDAFWKDDAAYALAAGWHRNNEIPLDERGYYEGWLEWMRERAAMPEEQRRADPAFALLEQIRARTEAFQENSIPLLDSFLPKNALRFESTIHITTRTFPFAIMTSGQIVADPLSAHFASDPDRLLNLLTHECFHVGYGWNRSLRTETGLARGMVYDTMLDGLQNEGIATWVGYNTRPFFPATDEPDYVALDDPDEVRHKLAALNDLFERSSSLDDEELREVAWKAGVEQRGYYVVGAHMARTIDMTAGRGELLRTIATGPLEFVDAYNRLVPPEMRVLEFARDDEGVDLASLKSAVIANDHETFDDARAALAARTDPAPDRTRRQLERFGYAMLRLGEVDWAIATFEVDTLLFPEEANSWDSLAEAWWRKGDTERAVRYYERAAQVDPGWENAPRMIAKIQEERSSRSARASRIADIMQRQFEAGSFNGVFLVADREGVLSEGALGFASEEWKVPNTLDTRFRIGSLTKQFTASLILHLVDEGKLSLDTTLAEALPWYRGDTGRRVTIRQLLNHSSGIDRQGVGTMIEEHGRVAMPLAEEVRMYCSGDLEWEPGEDVGYNNAGYLILGAVVEETFGKPYAEALTEVILDPVGMRDTGMDEGQRVIARYASGYERRDAGLQRPSFVHAALAASAGGAYATARDLFLWDRALYTDAVLSKGSRDAMFAPGLGAAGFGWFIETIDVGGKSMTMIHHPGQGDGFWSSVHRFPDDESVIILINNHGRTDLGAMAEEILGVLHDPVASR